MGRFDVYVDGSYNQSISTVYGAFILLDNGTPTLACRITTKDKRFVSQWNVGGELLAAAAGISNSMPFLKEARDKNECLESYITVYHDFIGIHHFILPPKPGKKPWRPKEKDGAGATYKNMVDIILEQYYPLKVVFSKVDAHTGNKWNEVVDGIAGGRILNYDGLEVIQQNL